MRKGFHGPLAKSKNGPPPELVYVPPKGNGLPILHVDEQIIVLAKPAGLLSVPGNKPELQDCLETRVQGKFPSATTVHRLDRPTSGVCIMALTPDAHKKLGLQFEKRQTSKTYKAIVVGVVAADKGTIELPLRTDWYNRPKQMVDTYMGREAITHWRVLDRIDGNTMMELKPLTGRSHQLRVHMQSMGHPIVGDEFYCDAKNENRGKRLMLHAETLEVTHPLTNKRMRFHAPCEF